MGISTIKQPIDWSKFNIFSEFPELVKNYGMDAADYILSGGASDLYTKMNVGFDVTDEDILRHRMNKSMNYDGGLKGYKHINTNSIPVSDATDGYHIRSGIDFANLATDDLPGGGIPAALSGIGYQQLAGLFDGTVGKNAFLQSVDNIRGLRESGKAPALDALYNFGGGVHNLFNNPSSIDVTALGGPRAKGNIFNQGQIEVEDYTTKQNRVLAERAAEQQRIAEQQRVAEQQRIKQQQSINPVAGIPQAEYQTRMDDVYKNVVVDNAGNTGYTGTGDQGRGAYFQTPAYRGQQAAAAVDRKSASMGVASPIRRTPGTKYGFGL